MCKTKKKNNLLTLNFKKILLVYACMSYGLPKPLRERERERETKSICYQYTRMNNIYFDSKLHFLIKEF